MINLLIGCDVLFYNYFVTGYMNPIYLMRQKGPKPYISSCPDNRIKKISPKRSRYRVPVFFTLPKIIESYQLPGFSPAFVEYLPDRFCEDHSAGSVWFEIPDN